MMATCGNVSVVKVMFFYISESQTESKKLHHWLGSSFMWGIINCLWHTIASRCILKLKQSASPVNGELKSYNVQMVQKNWLYSGSWYLYILTASMNVFEKMRLYSGPWYLYILTALMNVFESYNLFDIKFHLQLWKIEASNRDKL